MGKAPAFQFYVKDWLSDPELRCVSASTRGMWIDALCYMWEAPERGKLSASKEEMAKLLFATNGDFLKFLDDANRHKFCDVTIRDNEVTLINRRMYREQKAKENHTLRQQRYRERQKSDVNVTSPSSSSSSSPTPKKKKNILSDEEFLISLKEKFTWVDFDKEMAKMDAWFLANPGRKKTRRFMVNWLGRVDKPMSVNHKIEGDYPSARDVLLRQGFTMKDLK